MQKLGKELALTFLRKHEAAMACNDALEIERNDAST
jgi:hypothetical protein